eukprot:217551-Amphidinium_carterae.1
MRRDLAPPERTTSLGFAANSSTLWIQRRMALWWLVLQVVSLCPNETRLQELVLPISTGMWLAKAWKGPAQNLDSG